MVHTWSTWRSTRHCDLRTHEQTDFLYNIGTDTAQFRLLGKIPSDEYQSPSLASFSCRIRNSTPATAIVVHRPRSLLITGPTRSNYNVLEDGNPPVWLNHMSTNPCQTKFKRRTDSLQQSTYLLHPT